MRNRARLLDPLPLAAPNYKFVASDSLGDIEFDRGFSIRFSRDGLNMIRTGGGDNSYFAIRTGDTDINRLVVDLTGNVGIGTTDPGVYRLYVDGGSLYVSGDIDSGGTKNFVIPHQTEDNMQLVHSTLEGSEAAVFYRGEAQLVNGQAVVELPDYFEALTRAEGGIVLLTCLNSWAPLYVDGGVEDGRFTVRTTGEGDPAQFYWEVKAMRADVPPLEVERPAGSSKPPPPKTQVPFFSQFYELVIFTSEMLHQSESSHLTLCPKRLHWRRPSWPSDERAVIHSSAFRRCFPLSVKK